MDKKIIYTTVEQQIKKLKSQNLIINNEIAAKKHLKLCGYSNLIKSYRDPYIIRSDNSIKYRSGVSIEQIYSLYILDRNLRNSVMAAMQDLEEHVKENAASVLAKSFGVSQNDYLKFKNYQNRKKHNPRFNLPNILDTLNDKLFTDKDPIHHYNTKYGAVPPWILFKSVFFSTMVNFIDLFKAKEKIELVNLLYDKNKINLSEDKLCKLMMDTLYICLDYRNVSAHGGRTYNHISNNSLRFEEIFGHHSDAPYGFSELLFLLELLNYDRPAKVLRNTLEREISRHCNSYPQDITYLGQILNINIVPRDMVYISKKSGKYHFVPHCSGLSKTIQMEMDEAIKNGYVPCKRCTQQ